MTAVQESVETSTPTTTPDSAPESGVTQPTTSAPGIRYTIRTQFFKIFGSNFDVLDPAGNLVAHCHQKAFKLREDIRLYTDKEKQTPVLNIAAQSILDFSTTYDIVLPTGESLGSFRRKGMASTFIRDSWLIFDEQGQEIATLKEDSAGMAILRRILDGAAFLFPQTFYLEHADGRRIAEFKQHFNPLVYKLSVTVLEEDDAIDDLMLLAGGMLISAIEGRQS